MSEEKYLYAIIKVPIKITNNKPTILPEYSSIIFEKCDQISENIDSLIALIYTHLDSTFTSHLEELV
jgi:hypothetical protein